MTAPVDTPESVEAEAWRCEQQAKDCFQQEARDGDWAAMVTHDILLCASEALRRYAALLRAPSGGVKVKALNWWERVKGEEWTACHGDNVYLVKRQDDDTFRVTQPQRGDLLVGRTMVLGIFATAEEGRDCAQADHDGRILACLEGR